MDKSFDMAISMVQHLRLVPPSLQHNRRLQLMHAPRFRPLLCTRLRVDLTVHMHSLCNFHRWKMQCSPHGTARSKLIHYFRKLVPPRSCDIRSQNYMLLLSSLETVRELHALCYKINQIHWLAMCFLLKYPHSLPIVIRNCGASHFQVIATEEKEQAIAQQTN